MAFPDLSAVRVVYCDLYSTLLEVGPGAADPEAAWADLWRTTFATPPAASLRNFGDRVRAEVGLRHAVGKSRGLVRPEIDWPDVACHVEPAFRSLSASALSDFLLGHARIERSTRLMPGAAECWKKMASRGLRLGLLSNAQAVSRREWAEALAAAGESDPFEPPLTFFSYEHGVAKPDPAFYEAAERAAGVPPGAILMVGDRLDNDIVPTRARGWRTWRFSPVPVRRGGDWAALAAALP